MSVRAVLRECMADLLDTEPNTTVEHIVRCAYRNYPDVFADRAEEMMLNAARALTRDMLREWCVVIAEEPVVYANRCPEYQPHGSRRCMKDPGHPGPHMAFNGDCPILWDEYRQWAETYGHTP